MPRNVWQGARLAQYLVPSLQQALSLGKGSCLAAHCAGTVSTINGVFDPSVDDQAVSVSDDGTTIIIDFFSFFLFFLPPSLKSQKGLS